ncbi:carboxymuconolactone decarboxylase family protein [Hoyosella rhizosphaerae]|uniref:4-carboxymuconolactone decarboxylase n=1 Tax=Hoyosella rhizosphaerae TaxID=1755582 RepID=A0A916UJP6_9ACTN|nr:carboxymuconolactone decarboxylase family protein [Hoyosella rhizosphaerae]MBN4928421.1 carboxymuconolactone decarboxylase family protein [Hoyosella rhizosphaerae]GGC74813.1 4-carboxymuconolactone decarboxylase [Hoyosella rhizosphaerae]
MTPRIPPGSLRELGPSNWAFSRFAAKVMRVNDVHLFSTLGHTRGLFRAWLMFSARLMPFGSLPRYEVEMMILRIAILRGCTYEYDHHEKLGKRAGLSRAIINRIEAGPSAPGWSTRHHALLVAVDQLINTKDIDDETWARLDRFFNHRELVEIVLLIGQYDSLATTIRALRIERDQRIVKPQRIVEPQPSHGQLAER